MDFQDLKWHDFVFLQGKALRGVRKRSEALRGVKKRSDWNTVSEQICSAKLTETKFA
jgi:hypothetical protein